MKQIYFFLYLGTPRPQNDPAKNVEWREGLRIEMYRDWSGGFRHFTGGE